MPDLDTRQWVWAISRRAADTMTTLHTLGVGPVPYADLRGLDLPRSFVPPAPARLRAPGWSLLPVPQRRASDKGGPLDWHDAQWLAVPPEAGGEPARLFASRRAALRWICNREETR